MALFNVMASTYLNYFHLFNKKQRSELCPGLSDYGCYAGNPGSNPLGDAKEYQRLRDKNLSLFLLAISYPALYPAAAPVFVSQQSGLSFNPATKKAAFIIFFCRSKHSGLSSPAASPAASPAKTTWRPSPASLSSQARTIARDQGAGNSIILTGGIYFRPQTRQSPPVGNLRALPDAWGPIPPKTVSAKSGVDVNGRWQ
jgi:hypothetical protein